MCAAETEQSAASKMSSKRSRKRARLIELASMRMNRQGAASVDLSTIGAELGISRNTVYYYFKNKNALTVACYDSSLSLLESALQGATNTSGSFLTQLTAFVEYSLNEQAHTVAVMSDLTLTTESETQELADRQNALLQHLSQLIEHGVSAGEFRRISPTLTAQVLLSMVEWKRLWVAFMKPEFGALSEGAKAITRWLREGVIVDRDYQLSQRPHIDQVLPNSVDVMDRSSITQQKLNQLLGKTSALFNRRGIDATTIDDIASTLNCTKGFVYHYVDDKEHLVRLCYDRAFEIYERIFERSVLDCPGSADSMTMAFHLNAQAQLSDFPPLTVQSRVGELPPKYRARSKRIWGRYVANVHAAIANGEAHAGSEKLVDITAGAFFWLGKSDKPKSDIENLPNDLVDLIALGLCKQ
jgi:AcrR family transcriptional regulator